MAVANYESLNGHVPSATTSNGFHSWRATLLPFVEKKEIFEAIDFDSPWDSIANAKLRSRTPHGLQCHSCEDGTGRTQIFAVTAPDSVWQERAIKFDDITDDLSQTLLFIELDLPNVNWMSTTDVSLHELQSMLEENGRLPSPHPAGVLMAFADGSVRLVQHDAITPSLLRELVLIETDVLKPKPDKPENNPK